MGVTLDKSGLLEQNWASFPELHEKGGYLNNIVFCFFVFLERKSKQWKIVDKQKIFFIPRKIICSGLLGIVMCMLAFVEY